MTVESLLARNRAWSHRMCCGDADLFARLARQQKPAYLRIGCSDSRVPSNQILNLAPGEVFTHRNIANVVASRDLNCLSVIHFAVDILKVRHIMVVGRYSCSGIRAAVEGLRLVNYWLGHVSAVHSRQLGDAASSRAGRQVVRAQRGRAIPHRVPLTGDGRFECFE